jgi:hypothetical protein
LVFVFFFALAVEADFFLVTFFCASFRLDVDVPAVAVFFLLVFFAAFFATFFPDVFLTADFFRDTAFLLEVAFFLEAVFLLEGFFARAAADVGEARFAVFLLVRFLAAAFFVGIQEIPGWLQMQPAIIHT